MGLKIIIVAFAIVLNGLIGCTATNAVTPAERVKNKTFWYDCCNPGITSGTKEMCELAKDSPNHTLKDEAGNRYKFIWSDCEVGKEPWKDYE